MKTADAALQYQSRGWQSLPVPVRSKNPGFDDWTEFTCTADEIPRYFSNGGNIGLLLGTPSHGLVDIDLDARETLMIAPALLPPTSLISGRPGNPRSHFWYDVDPPNVHSEKFFYILKNGGGQKVMLVEFRATGGHTLVPPSEHPEGDHYEWYSFGEPTKLRAEDLLRIVKKIAIGALLARFWPGPGARHDAALPIAGLFVGVGWTEEEAAELVFLASKAAGHTDPEDRRRVVRDTYQKRANGQAIRGIPTLKEFVPAEIVDTICKWCVEISPNPPKRHDSEEETDKRGPSQATKLVALADDATLFHTPDGEAWATIRVNDHAEHWPRFSHKKGA